MSFPLLFPLSALSSSLGSTISHMPLDSGALLVSADAVAYTEYRNAHTMTALDIVYALKRQGRTLYGFDTK